MERRPELTIIENETDDCEKSTETLITAVLSDIRQKGFSAIQPFSIGLVEERMIQLRSECVE